MILLAVDPGLIHPAAAVFSNGNLVAASRVSVPKGIGPKTPIGQRCRVIAFAITEWAQKQAGHPTELIVEWPRVYRASKSKGDPNNLLPLVGVGMCLAGFYPDATLHSPTPSEWIGQVPKTTTGSAWDSPRGAKIRSKLSELEISKINLSHDALDAVGLGLFALGRLDRIRVYK